MSSISESVEYAILFNRPDDQVFSTPSWRNTADRLTHAAFLEADSGLDYVKNAHSRLVLPIRHMADQQALPAYRRAIRVLLALANLSQRDRSILAGNLHHNDAWNRTGAQQLELLSRRQREIWASNPDLTEFQAGIEAQAAAAIESQQQRNAQDAAAKAEAERIAAAAPETILAWHARAIRLDLVAGRLRAFPASLLSGEERALLDQHNPAFVAAVQSEWTT